MNKSKTIKPILPLKYQDLSHIQPSTRAAIEAMIENLRSTGNRSKAS